MKRISILLILPLILQAQYWGEQVNEKKFEQSGVYFNSHYLNPFGINRFSDLLSDLVEDPFAAIQRNPANMPLDSSRSNLIYFDFRGDRNEPQVLSYAIPTPFMYGDVAAYHAPSIDPRWYDKLRPEPQPVFSLGAIFRPAQRFYFAGSYQLIFKNEPYYQPPVWLYNAQYGRSAFGDELADPQASVPTIDRYSGSDEMLTRGHFLNAAAGYQLLPRLDIGLGLGLVFHERDGRYGNLNRDFYSSTNDDDWYNEYYLDRQQDYRHIDLSAGARYHLSDKVKLGLKLGYLDGKAEQDFFKRDSSLYSYSYNSPPYSSWHNSFRNSTSVQDWQRNGRNYYGALQLDYAINPGRSLMIYYSQNRTKLDLSNNSTIIDTSFYAGSWSNESHASHYQSNSGFSDLRSGDGQSTRHRQQLLLRFRWQEIPRTTVHLGLFLSSQTLEYTVSEPVIMRSHYHYEGEYQDYPADPETVTHYYSRGEDKRLQWNYKLTARSIQIPVFLDYELLDQWHLLLGVNRIWKVWETEDQTVARFKKREINQNGEIEKNENFAERYTSPRETITENLTDFITGLELRLSPDFNIRLLVDPENDPDWRVAQWWLGFNMSL